MKKLFLLAFAGFPLLFSCSENNRKPAESTAVNTEAIQPALTSFTADDILKHTKVLASDAYEGRAPGTKGEDSAVTYLTRQFKQLGLSPGNPNGTYIQDVPLYGFTSQPTASF